jgi:hypothetical protein
VKEVVGEPVPSEYKQGGERNKHKQLSVESNGKKGNFPCSMPLETVLCLTGTTIFRAGVSNEQNRKI